MSAVRLSWRCNTGLPGTSHGLERDEAEVRTKGNGQAAAEVTAKLILGGFYPARGETIRATGNTSDFYLRQSQAGSGNENNKAVKSEDSLRS
jgi:hypothetical protein